MVHVHPALRSLGGCPARRAQRQFRTGTVDGAARPAPARDDSSDVQAIFAARCAGGLPRRDADRRLPGGAGRRGCRSAPPTRGDALVDVPSRQQAGTPSSTPSDSARSYLLRKLFPRPRPARWLPTLGHRGGPGEPRRAELRIIGGLDRRRSAPREAISLTANVNSGSCR